VVMCRDGTYRAEPPMVVCPPIKAEPVHTIGDRLYGALLDAEAPGIQEPPQLHAKPRGFLIGAAISLGKA